MRVLGVIPARGGSKGLPRKNVRPMLGKPLIAWTVTQAAKSNYLDRVIVSTDDDEIAAIARAHGADIPFIRPAELARDDSPVADAVVHALTTLKNAGDSYGFVALLEPTSPMRRRGDIDCGLKLRSEEHTSELQSQSNLVCRLLLEKKKKNIVYYGD